jgi:hypothetical protein
VAHFAKLFSGSRFIFWALTPLLLLIVIAISVPTIFVIHTLEQLCSGMIAVNSSQAHAGFNIVVKTYSAASLGVWN